jgi:hypothetical protein
MSMGANIVADDFGTSAEQTINVADYGVLPDGTDATRPLKKALEACRVRGTKRLIFPPGRYDFRPEHAEELYLHVSNNDEGLKRITFLLRDLRDLTIDGQGSEFVFHGFLNPFLVHRSTDIVFKNFSIDFSRPFHSEGLVVATSEAGVDVFIDAHFPYRVQNGLLVFVEREEKNPALTTVSKECIYGSGHLLLYDTDRRETAFMAEDLFFNGTRSYPAEDLGGRVVRLRIPNFQAEPGKTLSFGPDHRNYPAFVVSHSADVTFEQVTIHHAGGMGILGQFSHNLLVRGCKVTPSPGRMISTTADATHFVNCTGRIDLVGNLFENHKDDATNIHGLYVQIAEIVSPHEVLVQWRHAQQHGLELFQTGGAVEFVQGASMIDLGTAVVRGVTRLNKEFTSVTFEAKLPAEVRVGDVIAAAIDHPEVRIVSNTIRNNRARGMLLNCRGKTLVEGNYFHTPGAAILFEGDACEWFEQGGVRDCVIRDNMFDNCLFGVWGRAVIDVMPGIRERKEVSRYNRNIRIERNVFRMFDYLPLLHAYCVDGLTWKGNHVERTDAYPRLNKNLPPFLVSHCDNIVFDSHSL